MIEMYKNKYETCLEMLHRLRREQPVLRDEVLSYAGILDPMAEGVVPVLVGKEENMNRGAYHGTSKVYEVGVLVGVRTDSGDLLGLVKESDGQNVSVSGIIQHFLSYPREFDQIVPMHSNRKVNGKRLWWWMLQGTEIPPEKRPKNHVVIHELAFVGQYATTVEELHVAVESMHSHFPDRFRIEHVYSSWQTYFLHSNVTRFVVLTFSLHVSSGFYVRVFVESISDLCTMPLLVYSLKRNAVLL
jgi:tRNA pseudouridine(55) synthase